MIKLFDKALISSPIKSIPGLIASKAVFYYITVSAEEQIRNDLRIITGYAEDLLNKKEESEKGSPALKFGHLHIIISDRQNRKAKDRKIAAKSVEENIFSSEKILSDDNRKTAKIITDAFESINVWNLPTILPVELNEDTKVYDQEPSTESRFSETMAEIKAKLLEQLSSPRLIGGELLTGKNFAAMIGPVLETVNAGKPIPMDSIEDLLAPPSVKVDRIKTKHMETDKNEMDKFFENQLMVNVDQGIISSKVDVAHQKFCAAIETEIPNLKPEILKIECDSFQVELARRW